MIRSCLFVLVVGALSGGCSTHTATDSTQPDSDREARAAHIVAGQAEGARLPGYRISRPSELRRASQLAFTGNNPAMQFVTEFGQSGPHIVSRSQTWGATISLQGIRCDGRELVPVEPSEPELDGVHRVKQRRRAGVREIEEWYVNGPLGLEQGFTFGSPPCSSAATEFSIELGIEGLTPRQHGDRVDLVDESGSTRLVYSDLFAFDTRNVALPTSLTAREDGATLRVRTDGAVFPVVVDPLIWVEQPKLTPTDGAGGDNFGRAVAIDGDTLIVGAPEDDIGLNAGQGSAYVFVRNGSTWTEQQKLTAPNGASDDRFGAAVAISGNTAVIGAQEAVFSAGAAYVFVRSGTTWSFQQQLTPGDADEVMYLGSAVAISGDTAIVGARGSPPYAVYVEGAAYAFVRSGSTWTQQQKLTPPRSQGGLFFGISVAVSGNTALIGTQTDITPPFGLNDVGLAYAFERSGTTWTSQELSASDQQQNSLFGAAVALEGNTALVGAPQTAVGTNGSQGAAYVLTRSAPGSAWEEQQRLTVADGLLGDQLGMSVALSGHNALLGTVGIDAPPGSAYWFRRSGSSWAEAQKLLASDPNDNDGFGRSVAISSSVAFVGAPADDFGAQGDRGSAYEFFLANTDGESCASGNQCHSGYCVDDVCCDAACDAPCDACSVAAGAATDGVCALVAAGSAGAPECAGVLACTGASAECGPCSEDEHCGVDDYCDLDGICRARKAQGAACDAAAAADCLVADCRVCASGVCADGYCCDVTCSGCSACANAITGQPNGTCAPVPAGEDAHDVCEEAADPCLADGHCDGEGACRDYAPRGTVCGATVCVEAEVSGLLCSGEGSCDSDSQSCGPFRCDGANCGTICSGDSDCVDAAYCVADSCIIRKGPGEDCSENRECESAFCVDGVCCNSACDNQCEACAEPNTAGTCTQVLGDPRGKRPACPTNLSCRGGECVPPDTTACSEDGAMQLNPNGTSDDCAPYVCDGIACLLSCRSSSDCVSSFVCEMESNTCVAARASADADGGCGCRTVGQRSSLHWWTLGLALFALRSRRVARTTFGLRPLHRRP